jgi:hypothetical protein
MKKRKMNIIKKLMAENVKLKEIFAILKELEKLILTKLKKIQNSV